MIRVKKLSLTACFMLATILTFSCSSEDDKGGDYLTCSEAENVIIQCLSETEAANQAGKIGKDCPKIEGKQECQEAAYDNAFSKCLDRRKICGNNSFIDNEECEMHYSMMGCNLEGGESYEEDNELPICEEQEQDEEEEQEQSGSPIIQQMPIISAKQPCK